MKNKLVSLSAALLVGMSFVTAFQESAQASYSRCLQWGWRHGKWVCLYRQQPFHWNYRYRYRHYKWRKSSLPVQYALNPEL